MTDLVALLEDEGLPVVDERVASAPGAFSPIGCCFHHTASRPPAPAPSLRVVKFGNQGTAPGPLCNILVGRDLIVRVITDGKANDSGMGSTLVLDRVRQGLAPLGDARQFAPVSNINGNPFFYDVEIENDGVGEPWPAALVEVSCRVVAAILRRHGWSANRAILHREWTARKIDPNWAAGPSWRLITDTFLRPNVTAADVPATPLEEEEMPYLMLKDTRDGTIWALFPGGAVRHIGGAEFAAYADGKVPLADCVVNEGESDPHAEANRLKSSVG